MGLVASFMGRGLPTTQLLNLVMKTLYDSFVKKEIKNFDDFHVAILDIFNTFNSALPGKHYDAPSFEEVKAFYEDWQAKPTKEEKKEKFVEFMKKKVTMSKLDDSTLIAGLVTPPAAMAAKKAGENVPQLKIIKAVPDVLFVPSVTVLALISVKVSRKVLYTRMVHHDQPRA